MKEKCEMLFSDEMMNRITWLNSEKYMRVDLHGMTKNKALHFIQSLFLLNRQPFTMDVVHGYHGGTVLKEALANELQTRKVYEMIRSEKNPGVTRFVVSVV